MLSRACHHLLLHHPLLALECCQAAHHQIHLQGLLLAHLTLFSICRQYEKSSKLEDASCSLPSFSFSSHRLALSFEPFQLVFSKRSMISFQVWRIVLPVHHRLKQILLGQDQEDRFSWSHFLAKICQQGLYQTSLFSNALELSSSSNQLMTFIVLFLASILHPSTSSIRYSTVKFSKYSKPNHA